MFVLRINFFVRIKWQKILKYKKVNTARLGVKKYICTYWPVLLSSTKMEISAHAKENNGGKGGYDTKLSKK